MFNFFKTEEKKKPNKFEAISPEPFVNIALESPYMASKILRDRYSELSDCAHPNAIGGIHWDERLKGWQKLAELLSENDPVLAKTIYIPLLRTRNWRTSKKIQKDFIPDMDVVAQQLFDLENKVPEIKEEGKIAVLSALVNCAAPDQALWVKCLERAFELAMEDPNPEEEGPLFFIAAIAFYAENKHTIMTPALNHVSERLRNPKLFINNKKPSWSKGYLFNRLNDFCIKEHISSRNFAFEANPNSELYFLINQIFWEWVEDCTKNKSFDALALLQHAIHTDDKKLSLKASEVYKQNFYDLAVQSPKKASECLREIASYSCCYFTDDMGREERHQNINLYDVFDYTIPILKELDKEAGIYPFFAFIKSHGNVPLRMQAKYKDQINTALGIQIRNRKS